MFITNLQGQSKSLRYKRTVKTEIFASIKFSDFVAKSSVFIFVSTIFRES